MSFFGILRTLAVLSILAVAVPGLRTPSAVASGRQRFCGRYGQQCASSHYRGCCPGLVCVLPHACTQRAQYRSTQQLTHIPHAWTRPSCEAMDQANEIKLIRHRRQVAAHCMRGDEESAIAHELENAMEASREYNDFSANRNSPLNSVSHVKSAPHFRVFLASSPAGA